MSMFGQFFERASNFSLAESEHTPLIRSELTKVRGPKKTHSSGLFIRCPFHKDNSPSCLVNTVNTAKGGAGSFYCFGCNETGNWNKLADALGLQKISQGKAQDYIPPIREKRAAVSLDSLNDSLLTDPITRDWRGVKAELLQAIGAKMLVLKDKPEIFLPVIVYGEMIGGIRALPKKIEGEQSYINSPGNWALDQGLFPFDFIRERSHKDYIVLVEGPRDALSLIQRGIPALSIIGAMSWSRAKKNLLLGLEKDMVFIMMDSDQAGREASARLDKSLSPSISTIVVPMAKAGKIIGHKLDPANMPEDLFQHFRKKYNW